MWEGIRSLMSEAIGIADGSYFKGRRRGGEEKDKDI